MAYGEDGLRPEQYDLREAAHADGARITRAKSAFGVSCKHITGCVPSFTGLLGSAVSLK